MSDTTPIGTLPEIGEVPKKMFAQVVRQERFGDPRTAFQVEEIDLPEIKPHEVLIGVMAAGINYNNVWAARGIPIDVILIRQKMGEHAHGRAHVHIEDLLHDAHGGLHRGHHD